MSASDPGAVPVTLSESGVAVPCPRPLLRRHGAIGLVVLVLAAGVARGQDTANEPAAADWIARLGDDDFDVREAAASRLRELGPRVIDDLLAAAETSDDVEVALRARWIVEAIPLDMPHDPPAVVQILSSYKRGKPAERFQALRRLVRLEDEEGIEALARIVRLDQSTISSRAAAAMLAREWYPDDSSFERMRPRILAGLGASRRPAATFLRALVSMGDDDAAVRAAAPADALAAFAAIDRTADGDRGVGELVLVPADNREPTGGRVNAILGRALVRLLVAADRRADALAAAADLLRRAPKGLGGDLDAVTLATAETLAWCVHHGVADTAAVLDEPAFAAVRDQPLVSLARALAERERGREAEAEAIADRAMARAASLGDERLEIAMRLARWNAPQWTSRVYDAIVDDAALSLAERLLAAILYAEFLHDQGHDTEAARRLREALERRDGRTDVDDVLRQFDREQRSLRARHLYFDACAAAARGDGAEQRRLLEQALSAYDKEVDALIAFYGLADNTPESQAQALERVEEALRRIDNEIQATPDQPNGYNEYAWLTANTRGDVEKATRYSRVSLDSSFDNASYLDTLAHCRAAVGDFDGAVRWQSRARRQDPGSAAIARNLERFQRLAAAAQAR